MRPKALRVSSLTFGPQRYSKPDAIISLGWHYHIEENTDVFREFNGASTSNISSLGPIRMRDWLSIHFTLGPLDLCHVTVYVSVELCNELSQGNSAAILVLDLKGGWWLVPLLHRIVDVPIFLVRKITDIDLFDAA
jgi:hypothetical protein